MWWMISTKVMIWPFWKTKAWNSSLESPDLCWATVVRSGPFGEPWIRRGICLKGNYDSRTSHWEINSRRKGFMDRPSNTNFSVLKSTSKENSIHKYKWPLTTVTIMKSRVPIRPKISLCDLRWPFLIFAYIRSRGTLKKMILVAVKTLKTKVKILMMI